MPDVVVAIEPKPIGRPPVGPRLTVRLYPAERLMLEGCAGVTNETLSEFVRAAVAERCERVAAAYVAQLDAFVTAEEKSGGVTA